LTFANLFLFIFSLLFAHLIFYPLLCHLKQLKKIRRIKMEAQIEYKTTKAQCQAHIDKYNNVCMGCGGKLEPIETVDNSGDPTFWSGCMKCSCFDSGVKKEIFETAKDLVLNQGYVEYSHMGSSYSLEGEKLNYWQTSQIRGACRTVLQVINTYKKITP
jgi:hypothetical protein